MVHGWAAHEIFNYNFMAAPVVKDFSWHMNPREVDRVRLEAGEVDGNDEELDNADQIFSKTNVPSNKQQTTNPLRKTKINLPDLDHTLPPNGTN